jgi:hypothetical protein
MSRLHLLKALLVIAIAIIGLSLCLSLIASAGTGTFHADYYYLPLHEFVEPPRRDAMESRVIELFNAQQRRQATISFVCHSVCLASLVAALLLVTRLSDPHVVSPS